MNPAHHPRTLRTVFSLRMLVAALMGFSSGLPLLLTGSVLQAWMSQEGVDLATIGLFALTGLPYTLKFLWAPLMDRYALPLLGRRRGWLLVTQLALVAAIVTLAFARPDLSPLPVAAAALALTFFSASQDIVIDAYRRETLADNEQGLGASLYVNGYRLGMLLASGGGLILADLVAFRTVYLLMAAAMCIGIATTLLAPEPAVPEGTPSTLLDAVIQPFLEYFRRPDAWLILLFILLYKIGDQMASQMTTPFYLATGFSRTEIGTVVKLFGFWAVIGGSLLGGVSMIRLGVYRSLWVFGILQALSTAGFVALTLSGPHLGWLAAVVSFENVTQGMGTAAFIGFMASLTNKRFTATQYALLSSLIGIPRTFAAAPTGFLAETLGWAWFFLACALVAIPGLVLLLRFRGWLAGGAPAAGRSA